MSSSAATIELIGKSIAVLNGLISLSENASRYRAVIANAVAENRDLSESEIASLRISAEQAIEDALSD